jgi:hypothetical protein
MLGVIPNEVGVVPFGWTLKLFNQIGRTLRLLGKNVTERQMQQR